MGTLKNLVSMLLMCLMAASLAVPASATDVPYIGTGVGGVKNTGQTMSDGVDGQDVVLDDASGGDNVSAHGTGNAGEADGAKGEATVSPPQDAVRRVPSISEVLDTIGRTSEQVEFGESDPVAKRDYWLPDVTHGQCGDWEDVCRSTRRNVLDAISFCQTMEGGLSEIHFMLQRVYELTIQRINGEYDGTLSDVDVKAINDEIEELITEINFCQDHVAFDGFHFLKFDGQTFHAPVGCPYSCHHDWKISSMEPVRNLSVNSTLDDVGAAIQHISTYRSMLGANQNALDHFAVTCYKLLEGGFGNGIEYAKTDSSGSHHLLMVDMTGSRAFWAEWADIASRIELLEMQKNNSTYDDASINNINTEITMLNIAKDFLIDLLCEGTGAKQVVPEPSAPEASLIYAVVYDDGVGGSAFGEEVHGSLAEGDPTPVFRGNAMLDGYFVAGWDRDIKETVEADDANDDREIVYVAQWEPMLELPKTGGSGTMAYTAAGIVLVIVAGGVALWYAGRKRDGDGDRTPRGGE